MKRIVVALLLTLGVACSNNQSASDDQQATQLATDTEAGRESAEALKVCPLFEDGNMQDYSFNAMILQGVLNGVEPSEAAWSSHSFDSWDDDIIRQRLQALIELEDCTLIVPAVSPSSQPVIDVASRYPKVSFLYIDDTIQPPLPNVASVTFAQNEGAFLAGVLAASMTSTDTVGFVGAMPLPVIKDFESGYQQGINYVNPDVRLEAVYLTKDTTDHSVWNQSPEAAELTTQLIESQQVDVVFAAAGQSGQGMIEAAEAAGVYAIGVDTNQDYLAQGTVLTSVMKRFDLVTERFVVDYLAGRFRSGSYISSVADGGISLTAMDFTQDIVAEPVQERLNLLMNAVRQGELNVKTEMTRDGLVPLHSLQ